MVQRLGSMKVMVEYSDHEKHFRTNLQREWRCVRSDRDTNGASVELRRGEASQRSLPDARPISAFSRDRRPGWDCLLHRLVPTVAYGVFGPAKLSFHHP